VGRKCKERTPGERSGLEAGQENGYGQIYMEIPRVNLDTGRLKRTTKQASIYHSCNIKIAEFCTQSVFV
jgi:hypothetical protein